MTKAAPDFTIYRSGHPDVLAAWMSYEQTREDYKQRMLQQLKDWGFEDTTTFVVSNSAWTPTVLLGIAYPRHQTPPAGWRQDDKRYPSRIVPYRSTKKKNPKIIKEYDALHVVPDIRRDLVKFGMPNHMFISLAVTTYAARLVDGTVWIKWHECDPLASDQWWEKIKLSDFYAMVEAGSDPFAKDEAEEPAEA